MGIGPFLSVFEIIELFDLRASHELLGVKYQMSITKLRGVDNRVETRRKEKQGV